MNINELIKNSTILEHKEWLNDNDTQAMIKQVVDFLNKQATEYEQMKEYKGDNPFDHVFNEFMEAVHKNKKN